MFGNSTLKLRNNNACDDIAGCDSLSEAQGLGAVKSSLQTFTNYSDEENVLWQLL